MSMSAERTTSAAVTYPFCRSKRADVVLHTCDGKLFYVHKVLLSLVSPVFDDMFDHCQDSQAGSELPEVSLTEDSFVIDSLLRIFYPVENINWKFPDDIDRCLAAARKYDMRRCIAVLSNHLRLCWFSQEFRLQYFAVACRWRLQEAAASMALSIYLDAAARVKADNSSVSFDFDNPASGAKILYHKSMDDIPAVSFYHLLQHVCAHTLTTPLFYPPQNSGTEHNSYEPLDFNPPMEPGHPDLTLRATDGVSFQTHLHIIRRSSRLLEDISLREVTGTLDSSTSDVGVDLFIDGCVLSALVHMCYHEDSSDWTSSVVFGMDLKQAERVYMLALRHQVAHAQDFMIQRLRADLVQHPLKVFLLSARLGLHKVAQESAVQVARRDLAYTYDSELEEAEAHLYYTLLRFVHEYREAFLGLVNVKYREAAKKRWNEVCAVLAGHDGSGDPDGALAFVQGGMKKVSGRRKMHVVPPAARRETRSSTKGRGATASGPVAGKAASVLSKVKLKFNKNNTD